MSSRKYKHQKWFQSEAQAGIIYGRCVPMSGSNIELGKADIIGMGDYEGLLGENKYTDNESYTLKLETLKKIMREAIATQCDGFLRIDFHGEVFILVREQVFRSWFE